MSSSSLIIVLVVCVFTLALNSLINWWIMLRKPCTWQQAFIARVVGGILLAIPSAFFFHGNWIRTEWLQWPALAATIVFSVVGILFQKYRKQDEVDRRVYSYLYTAPASVTFITFEIIGWSIYLYSYELLFRGLMLQAMHQRHDWPITFLIGNVIYAFAHLQQGKREMLGSFFAGWIFSALAVWADGFGIAFIIHLALALANSYFTVRRTTLAVVDRSNPNSLGHVR